MGHKRKHSEASLQEKSDALPDQNDSLIGAEPSQKPSPRSRSGSDSEGEWQSQNDEGEWQTVKSRHRKKKKRIDDPTKDPSKYPEIYFAPNERRLSSMVPVSNLQQLVLYVLADGPAPNWVAVKHNNQIKKVVVLMVPGLEAGMFDGSIKLDAAQDRQDAGSADVDATEPARNAMFQSPQGIKAFSPDDYYPIKLENAELPEPLKPFAEIFSHIWPIKAPGDDKYSKLHSPVHNMLTTSFSKMKEEKKGYGAAPTKAGKDWENTPTPITELIATTEELQENRYTLEPTEEGWVYTTGQGPQSDASANDKQAAEQDEPTNGKAPDENPSFQGDPESKDKSPAPSIRTEDQGPSGRSSDRSYNAEKEKTKGERSDDFYNAGRKVLAIDCEMVLTEGDVSALARISVVGWDGQVVMDELVKPDRPIVDYLTPYSGMTAAKLNPVTTTLNDIQKRLLELITPDTVLVGHSLESDLTALKLVHHSIVDTSIVYPHARGPPLKCALKWLTQKYLSREIQRNHGSTGHDSIEDARACLELVKQKCERGPKWGTSESSGESIFLRLSRSNKLQWQSVTLATNEARTGAVVDWGDPRRGHGSRATVCVGCKADVSVVAAVKKAVNGDEADERNTAYVVGGVDFTWARLRELEVERGWYATKSAANAEPKDSLPTTHKNGASTNSNDNTQSSTSRLTKAVKQLADNVKEIYDSLPPRTAFIVYSGTGDPREYVRLQAQQKQFRDEYKTKKWDDLSVKWTDTEEQDLKRACRQARRGIGFMVVK